MKMDGTVKQHKDDVQRITSTENGATEITALAEDANLCTRYRLIRVLGAPESVAAVMTNKSKPARVLELPAIETGKTSHAI